MSDPAERTKKMAAVDDALKETERRFPEMLKTLEVFRAHISAAKYSDRALDSLYLQIQPCGSFL